VATGDFNGDGKVDLAITNESDNSVSILLGNGDGTFQAPPLEFTTASGATGVAAGDFNGDGRLDVAVAGFAVSIMRQRPEPPTNLTTPNVTASQVTLNWTASTSKTVIGYNVYRGTLPGGESLLQSSVAGTTFTDTTVAAGTTYYYVVTAVDPGNLESVNSNEVSVTIPLPPTNLMTSNVTAAQVMLTWNASPTAGVVGFNGYNVYRGTTLGGPYPTKVNVAIVAASPFTDTTVASGTTYYYVVKAVGPNNVESVVSNEASATTPP
jgi:fibronectin type 3 domain-containing protein